MSKNVLIAADGSALVSEDLGVNPDGSAASRSWSVAPDQVAAHIATWNDKDATQKLRPGDLSALQDAAADTAKKKARG